MGTEPTPVGFTIRPDKLEAKLVELSADAGYQGTLQEVEARPGNRGFLLRDTLGPGWDEFPTTDGPRTRLFWHFVYELFLDGGGLVAQPNGFYAKSVLFVKIKTKPDTWDVTAFISVSAELGRPLLVPFPQVPESLLDSASGASFR